MGWVMFFMICFGVFALYFGIRGLKKQKLYKTLDENCVWDDRKFLAISFQFLESIHIIDNTKNLNTLTSRIVFIDSIFPDLKGTHILPTYKMNVQDSINRFHKQYHDQTLGSELLDLLLEPDEYRLKVFYADSILKCFLKYYESQMQEMEKLVRESAIEKRRENIMRVGYDAKYTFKTFELPDTGQTDAIEKIREQFFYKKNKENRS